MSDPSISQTDLAKVNGLEALQKIHKAKSNDEGTEGPSFAEVMKKSILEANQLKQEADDAIQDLALGKTESYSEVLTAVEKADIAFKALMSIRNKLVDAYEEINRLRV